MSWDSINPFPKGVAQVAAGSNITITVPTKKAASAAREIESTTTKPAAPNAQKNIITSRGEVSFERASPNKGKASEYDHIAIGF